MSNTENKISSGTSEAAGICSDSGKDKLGLVVSSWDYQKLQNTISSTTDNGLVRACRDELENRLQMFDNEDSELPSYDEAIGSLNQPEEYKRRLTTSSRTINQELSSRFSAVSLQTTKKHDLSSWKYSELRDTINTSTDFHVLEACHQEFQRRLRAYHSWKGRNPGKDDSRKEADSGCPGSSSQSRYFRVPLKKDGVTKGYWYAEFNGETIAKQMEIWEGKDPVFLMAGRDENKMCEMKLSETGLTRNKPSTEIFKTEFDKEWTNPEFKTIFY